jgi:hypothetical protein
MRETNGYAKKPGKVTKVAGISFDMTPDIDGSMKLSPSEYQSELKKVGDVINNPSSGLKERARMMRQKYGIKGV